MKKARFMNCCYCGNRAPCVGARSVIGVGRCCAGCVEEMRQAKPLPEKAPAASSIGDCPRKAVRPMAEPAKRADGVTVCPSPAFHHRYGVEPSEVTPMFSAMRPGQYLEVAA